MNIIKHGDVYYGPFDDAEDAESWAENEAMPIDSYEVLSLQTPLIPDVPRS